MLMAKSAEMQQFTATELVSRTSDVMAAATRAPVKIAKHNKVRFVLLAVDTFEQLVHGQGTQRSVHVSDLSDAEADKMIAALQASIDED
jgi:PHD/YefM family antitoxin component YafN of YafNO toxin-antitoxin module